MGSANISGPEDVVTLAYEDLLHHRDLGDAIARAYGPEGLGLLVVRGVPDFPALRQALLPLAFEYAALPDAIKDKCVHPASKYSFGWSYGKEILRPGQFDEFKGSFYANPQYDVPFDDPEKVRLAPEVCHPNIWPSDADFPRLRPAFRALGQTMVAVGQLVARQCDRYVAEQLGSRYRDDLSLERILATSRSCKARLLHYFPINEDSTPRTRDSWCGWHNDHGSLTALCPAMYFEAEPGSPTAQRQDIPCPDKAAGLYVRTRRGEERHILIPKDAIAFQLGESSQVMTGGTLQATAHAVQALAWPHSRNISRSTFAVFMQPDTDMTMGSPHGTAEVDLRVGAFQPGMTFGEFSQATFARFYNPYG
jgi:isopenicillin N synthase-like dioxygenase